MRWEDRRWWVGGWRGEGRGPPLFHSLNKGGRSFLPVPHIKPFPLCTWRWDEVRQNKISNELRDTLGPINGTGLTPQDVSQVLFVTQTLWIYENQQWKAQTSLMIWKLKS